MLSPPTNFSTRSAISEAALLVKVMARIDSGITPICSIRKAMRNVMTRVFPLPAPARMSTGPSVVSTASRCCGFNSSKNDKREWLRNALIEFYRKVNTLRRRLWLPSQPAKFRFGVLTDCPPDAEDEYREQRKTDPLTVDQTPLKGIEHNQKAWDTNRQSDGRNGRQLQKGANC